jgi:hypothetical protein
VNTRTVLVRVLQRRTELVSAVALWLPELLWVVACLAFAGVFGLWWLLIPAAVIGIKVGLQIRAEQRQNQATVQAYLRAAARRREAAEQAKQAAAEQADADVIVVDGVTFR